MDVPGRMNHSQAYLKGFTLVELLVTLSLMGMVLLMGNAVYRIFDRMQVQYIKELDQSSEAGTFYTHLRDQARLSSLYELRGDTLVFMDQKKETLTRIYPWINQVISIRIDGRDTLDYSSPKFVAVDATRFLLIDTAGYTHTFVLPDHALTTEETP
ncbi:MAG: type II secretion system protein [Bacteroidota bacterium]